MHRKYLLFTYAKGISFTTKTFVFIPQKVAEFNIEVSGRDRNRFQIFRIRCKKFKKLTQTKI